MYEIRFNDFIKTKEIKIRKKVRSRLHKTAYHEAGHAVYAALLRMDFTKATIIPDLENHSLGHVDVKQDYGETDFYYLEENLPEQMIKLSMAGAVCTGMVTGKYNWVGASSDSDLAIDHAFSTVLELDLEVFPMQRLWDETVEFFEDDHNWSRVEITAKALLKKKELSFNEVFALLELERPTKESELFEELERKFKEQEANDLP